MPVQPQPLPFDPATIPGHEVGRATALRLRAAGLKARFLRGGLSAWQQAGRPVQSKASGET